jgi:hypothetical protein
LGPDEKALLSPHPPRTYWNPILQAGVSANIQKARMRLEKLKNVPGKEQGLGRSPAAMRIFSELHVQEQTFWSK